MSRNPADYVNPDRLWKRHMILATYGATASGGVNRQALSAEDAAARRQMIEWAQPLGLQVSTDAVGNLFFRLPSSDPLALPVLTGSHLDSQPTGGKFDGVYGVLAGLEAIEAMIAAGIKPHRPIELVAWMNEEGSRFAPGMMGSAVFAGDRTLEETLAVTDEGGVSVADALAIVNRQFPDVPIRALGGRVASYVEAHIEQGPVLESKGYSVGVVTGIQGKLTYRVTIKGEAAHAGTAARADRRDALLAAVVLIGEMTAQLHDHEDLVKFTVGRLVVSPNAPSVVPSDVSFSIDLRHPHSSELTRLGSRITNICSTYEGPCEVALEELSSAMSLEFPIYIRDKITAAAQQVGIPAMEIYSAAGHDARYMHGISLSGMIFVPCHKGITHNEAESVLPADLADGARVLTALLTDLTAG